MDLLFARPSLSVNLSLTIATCYCNLHKKNFEKAFEILQEAWYNKSMVEGKAALHRHGSAYGAAESGGRLAFRKRLVSLIISLHYRSLF